MVGEFYLSGEDAVGAVGERSSVCCATRSCTIFHNSHGAKNCYVGKATQEILFDGEIRFVDREELNFYEAGHDEPGSSDLNFIDVGQEWINRAVQLPDGA